MTATLKALGDMCPIDLNDPRVTQDAKNEFVIKIANESGLEIAPEHEAIFIEATGRLGLEPKFTVVSSEKTPPVERDTVITLPIAEAKTAEPDAKQQQKLEIAEVQPTPGRDMEALQSQVVEQQYQETTQPAEEFGNVVDITKPPTETTPALVPINTIEMYTRQTNEPAAEQVIYEAELLMAEPEPSSSITLPPVVEEYVGESIVPPSTELVTVDGVEVVPEKQAETTAQNWAEELRKEPAEIYDDFTAALASFARTTEALDIDSPAEPEGQPNVLTAEEMATKQIAKVVADRLTELTTDERQQAADVIRDIVGAVHGLKLLESQDADPELVEQVRVHLQELASNLSVILGLELDAQDIEYFVRAVSQLEFAPENLVAEADALDLENIGTHEAKMFTHFFGSDFADEDFASKALGMFTLICAGLHTKTPSAA